MTSEEYGQYIDDFELGADVMPGESLTEYIERRRREFESKADGGSIGIEVLFGPKREDFNIGGNVQRATTPQPYDPRASVADFARAIDKVGGGTDLQKAIDIDRYGKNIQRQNMVNRLQKMNPAGTGNFLQGIKDFGDHARVSQAMKGKVTGPGLTPGEIIPEYAMQSGYDFQKKFTGLDPKISAGLAAAYQTLQEGSRALNPFGDTFLRFPTAMKTAQEQATKNIEGILAAESNNLTAEQQANRNKFLASQGQPTEPVIDQNRISEIVEQQKAAGVPETGLITNFNRPTMSDVAGPAKTFTPDSEGYAAYEGIVPGFTARKRSDGRFEYKAPDGQVYGPDTYMSIAAGAYPNIYDPNKQTLADGGRVRMVSGGALKGLMSLFKRGGDDAVDLVKQEEIFREGPITTKFLEDVDDKLIKKFVRTRDTGGVGGYGMYDSFDDMPAGLKAAELISRIKKKGGGINYEAAELFLGKKLKGNESVDELIDIMLKDSPQLEKPIDDFYNYVLNTEKKADGGRVGLFMGGPALEGQALSIYNSMSAYGFSDQEIANALAERGLYTPGGATEETDIIASAPNIINQQTGGDGPPGPAPTGTKTYGKTFTGMTMPDGTPIGSSGVVEGPGIIDGLKNAATGLFDLYQKFSPFGIVSNFMKQRAEKQQEIQDNAIEKARKEREMQQAIKDAEAAQAALDNAVRTGRRPGSGSGPTTKDDGGGSAGTGGYSYDAGGREGFGYGLKEGGLATMFTRRR